MAEDTHLGILSLLACVHVCLAGNETTLTISPAQVSLPTDQALSLTCLKETAVNESVCRIRLLKVSKTSKTSRIRRVLVDLLNDGDMELLEVVDRSSPMVAAGQTADGSLQVNLTEVTCDHDGAYACQVIWVAHGGSSNQSRVCAMNETGEFINRDFTAEASSRVTVTVPPGQVNMTVSIGNPDMNLASLTLNCSVTSTWKGTVWKWEVEVERHGWRPVNSSTHTLYSDVSKAMTSSCRVTYSVLFRLLRSSDIGRQYRCFLQADGQDLTFYAAYYTLPQTALRGNIFAGGGREFIAESDHPENSFETLPSDTENDSKANSDVALMVVPTLSAVVLVGSAVGLFYNYRKRRERKTSSIAPPLVSSLKKRPDMRPWDLSSAGPHFGGGAGLGPGGGAYWKKRADVPAPALLAPPPVPVISPVSSQSSTHAFSLPSTRTSSMGEHSSQQHPQEEADHPPASDTRPQGIFASLGEEGTGLGILVGDLGRVREVTSDAGSESDEPADYAPMSDNPPQGVFASLGEEGTGLGILVGDLGHGHDVTSDAGSERALASDVSDAASDVGTDATSA